METPIADIWSQPNAREALTIFAMFCATYSTRLIGWLLLRNRTISCINKFLNSGICC